MHGMEGNAETAVAGRREWVALGVLVLPVLLISIDMTVLGFALPYLAEDLAPTGAQQLWIIDIYSFLLAGLLVLMGTVGDRIGRRRLLVFGALAFGGASALAAFSPSAVWLIGARALLGVGGATLMPSTLSLIRNMFVERGQRRLAIGVWSAALSAGMAIGPVLGGWLLEHFWWGSVFLINVPIMAVLVVALPLVPESRDLHPGRFDPLSAVLSLAALLPAVYGIKNIAEHGPSWTAGLAAVTGVGLGAVFVRRQRRLAHPLLDVRLFAHREFSVSILTNLLGVFAMVGLLFLLPQYLQLVLGLSPLSAALSVLPMSATAMFGALLGARLARHIRTAWLIGSGLGVAAVGYLILTQLGVSAGLVSVVLALALVGFGVSLSETLTNDLIVSVAPARRAGAAAAISETGFELGGALGTALLGSLATALYGAYLTPPPGISTAVGDQARDTLGGAVAASHDLHSPVGQALRDAASHAFVDALAFTAVAGAVLLAGAALQATVLLRQGSRSTR